MRYFYDCEFIEDGSTIDLISIGIVSSDGREYYAISKDITHGRQLRRLKRHDWLMANVIPALPRPGGDRTLTMPNHWLFDYCDPEVKSRRAIANEVRDFLLADSSPELWADYGAYDHVALCQLWGTMIDLPAGLPMYTNDIQQAGRRCAAPLPQQESGLHNALEDARHSRARWEFLNRELDGAL